MILTYDFATVEINGQSYDARVYYDEAPDGVDVYAVKALRQVAKAGDYWYDRNGDGHQGPHFVETDVTEFVDVQHYKEEVEDYLKQFTNQKPQRLRLAA